MTLTVAALAAGAVACTPAGPHGPSVSGSQVSGRSATPGRGADEQGRKVQKLAEPARPTGPAPSEETAPSEESAADDGVLRPATRPAVRRSISLGLEDVAGTDQNWDQIAERFDAAGITSVHLSAGRVEFTAFDWAAHPEAAAEPGEDHLATAIEHVGRMPDGSPREVSIMIDVLVPSWIAADPSLAGQDARGRRAEYVPSATALLHGPVGERYIDYLIAVAERYRPDQIAFSELAFDDETFGPEDLALYRTMTGRADWPRDAGGDIAEDSPEVASWRSDVLARFLRRAHTALGEVERRAGQEIRLATDVHVSWDDLAAGPAGVGHDYTELAPAVDELVLWAYLGTRGREPGDLADLTGALDEMPLSNDRLTVSIGLWDEQAPTTADGDVPAISPELLASSVAEAQSEHVAVNVTPYSLMSPDHWTALHGIWGDADGGT
ncbi:hypothetical protein GCM10023169_10230 [Georgenia halophila]|uniref:Family 10 glycosylhydrolase n=1 Tax=Georgenia halophila TaxID=620889 RepID=A0ABP8L0U8_9MICO